MCFILHNLDCNHNQNLNQSLNKKFLHNLSPPASSTLPNDDMFNALIKNTGNTLIKCLKGTAEKTGLPDKSMDWVSMASSFHWADFEKATAEFYRILRPRGVFTAIWNPRMIEVNPLLVEIENKLQELNPKIKRVSSGKSGMTETITQRLIDSKKFEDVIYIEGRHLIEMSTDRYLGAWKSVNDLQNQLGHEKFKEFQFIFTTNDCCSNET